MKKIYYFFTGMLILFLFSCAPEDEKEVQDIDGNKYGIVEIGSQKWITKNLHVKHYRNGDSIPQAHTPEEWFDFGVEGKGAWCYLDFSSEHEPVVGVLYNWFALSDPRGLAPAGWHISTDQEWIVLKDELGGFAFAGGKMKADEINYWGEPNENNNSSGFSAIAGGSCYYDGTFSPTNLGAFFWTSTETSANTALSWWLQSDVPVVDRIEANKRMGLSVRCVRN